jgi:hypothetical protein
MKTSKMRDRPIFGRVQSMFENHLIEQGVKAPLIEHLRRHAFGAAIAQAEDRRCPCCDRLDQTVRVRRRNSSYVNDTLNWLHSCASCFREDFEHFGDLWSDYYANVM